MTTSLRTLLTALAAVGTLAAAAPRPSPLPSPPPVPAPVHVNGPALEQAVVDATRAFLRSDAPGARAALDRAEDACRRLGYDDLPAAWPRVMVYDDVALHSALERARELASRGDIEKSMESVVWVARTCRECHDKRDGKVTGAKSPLQPEASTPR